MQVIRSSFYLRRVEYTCHYKNINKVAVQNKNVMFFLFLNKHDFYKRIYESETAFHFLSSDIINLQGFWALSMLNWSWLHWELSKLQRGKRNISFQKETSNKWREKFNKHALELTRH